MKKKKTEMTYSLNDLCTSINVLKSLTDNDDIKKILNKHYEEIKYAKPSKKEKVLFINNQIENKFDDIRLDLSHNDYEKAKENLDEVSSLLVKRKGATDSLKEVNKVGLFGRIFKRKRKLSRLQRSEVTDQIINLEKRQKEIVDKIESTDEQTKEYFEKGKSEKNLQMRTFYAKKIESINREKGANIKRATLLNYKLGLLNRLKDAIDDRDFFYDASETDVMSLLDNDKELNKFLTDIRTKQEVVEEKMVGIESKFDDFEQSNIENESIYGSRESTDDILAQMEMQSQLDDEDKLFKTGITERKIDKEEV